MSINLLKSKSQDEISEKILLISNKKEALEKAITYSATKAIIEILNNSKIVRSKGILKYKNTIELRYLINLLSVDTDINFKTTNESAFIEIFDIIKSKIENISANPTEDIITFYEKIIMFSTHSKFLYFELFKHIIESLSKENNKKINISFSIYFIKFIDAYPKLNNKNLKTKFIKFLLLMIKKNSLLNIPINEYYNLIIRNMSSGFILEISEIIIKSEEKFFKSYLKYTQKYINENKNLYIHEKIDVIISSGLLYSFYNNKNEYKTYLIKLFEDSNINLKSIILKECVNRNIYILDNIDIYKIFDSSNIVFIESLIHSGYVLTDENKDYLSKKLIISNISIHFALTYDIDLSHTLECVLKEIVFGNYLTLLDIFIKKYPQIFKSEKKILDLSKIYFLCEQLDRKKILFILKKQNEEFNKN